MKVGKREISKKVSKFIFIAVIISAFVAFFDSPAFSQAREFRSITGVEFYDGTIIRGEIIEMNADIKRVQKPDGSIETRKFNGTARFYKEGDTPQGITQQQKQEIKPCSQPSYSLLGPSNYFVMKAGIFSPQSDDLEGFDKGFNEEIAVGHYFNRHVALEVAVGYFQTEASFSGIIPGVGFSVVYKETDKLRLVPVTLSVKGILPISMVELYALGGIGLYFINGEAEGYVSGYSFYLEDDDVNFGVHLGAGVKFNITEEFFLGIEGKYVWTKADFKASYMGYTAHLDVDIGGFLVTGMIGFKF